MPNRSYGPKPQERAKRLLEDLLDYVNKDLEVTLSEKLTINWEKNKPELSVQGTLESLFELTKADKYPELLDKDKIEDDDAFQAQKQANQKFNYNLKIANSNVNLALRSLLVMVIPLEILSGVAYSYLTNNHQTNNSSESRPANTNNSASNTSSNNFSDLFKQTNTASSKSQMEKPNSESKPEGNFKCP